MTPAKIETKSTTIIGFIEFKKKDGTIGSKAIPLTYSVSIPNNEPVKN